MISSILLFYAGIAFAYLVVFKLMFAFFKDVLPGGVAMTPDIDAYLDFVLSMFLGFGLAFEVPIATVMLIWSGLVSVKTVAGAQALCVSRRLRRGNVAHAAGPALADSARRADVLLFEAGLVMARILLPEKTIVEKEVGT